MKTKQNVIWLVAALAASITVLLAVFLVLLGGVEGLMSGSPVGATIRTLLAQRPQVIIGLPVAGIASFAIVVLLKQVSGPIEFETTGIKVRGSTGQVVLWLICFVTIAAMIKWLW
jgi:hypothetical protein